ncbi:MAG: outer membrane protein assembly factor BamE [Alphaproteobacteria bacterium]|nr:outer membrane protein assembly factor BamE [Alphaproteobacteria bacterium]MBL0717750.1 outer membrane protein assembly factor BamE [Alphaproteobacteria bacterium]
MKKHLVILTVVVLLAGCSAGSHKKAVSGDTKNGLSIANVQRDIKVGMSSSDVIEVLGSPNMVTTDDDRRETWVYDKVSTNSAVSSSGSGLNLLLFGGSKSAGSASKNQKTLTIIVKFDESSKVRDFSYRQTSF